MKFALLAALALAFTGVTLYAAADEAAATCLPLKCDLPVDCKWTHDELATVYDPVTGEPYTVYQSSLVCYG